MSAHRGPPSIADTPFHRLTPASVLDALDSVALRGDGRLLQLNSYENRVFQVFLEDGEVVVAKFYRPGRWTDEQILEEHAFAAELAEAEVPVVAPLVLTAAPETTHAVELRGNPPTLAHVGDHRVAVTPRRAGRAPALESLDQFEWIGRFIGRMHAVGARRPFLHRATMSVAEFGTKARDWIREHDIVPPDAASAWERVVGEALDLVQRAFDKVGTTRSLRLHGDCHLGNVLWTDAGPHFVDLDDAVNGPAIHDFWMLLSGEPDAYGPQLRAMLSGYESFMDFDDRELALIEPLRTLRVIHHSAWLAKRWSDPAFPPAFPWFGGSSYWQQQTQVLQEQLPLLNQASRTAPEW
jgi:Ser/Thr protein kinase RdoA (MazF antagonist)